MTVPAEALDMLPQRLEERYINQSNTSIRLVEIGIHHQPGHILHKQRRIIMQAILIT